MSRIGRKFLRHGQRVVPEKRDGVLILAYHLVGAGTSCPVDIPEPAFRNQMGELSRFGRAVSLTEAVRSLGCQGASEKPLVVVTFDDAYENFRASAWPVLEELSIPVTLFVPVGFIEREAGAPIAGTDFLPPLSWRQLEDMSATGLLTFGSHGWSHADMRRLSKPAALEELTRSRRVLEDRSGQSVNSFCYPRGLWSRRAERWVGETYDLAVIGGGRRLTPSNFRPLRLWRVSVRNDLASLRPLLSASLWLEEWVADKARRLVRGWRDQYGGK